MIRLDFAQGEFIRLTDDHLVLGQRRVRHLTPEGEWSGIPPKNFGRARELRHAMSPPELAVWNRMRGNQLGVKFRKQHPIGNYIADFYCRECGLVVEIDGMQHGETNAAVEYDRRRDAFMEDLGIVVLRFTAFEVGTSLDDVISTIVCAARQHAVKDDPGKQWRFVESVKAGELLHGGPGQTPRVIASIALDSRDTDNYDICVEGHDSFLTQYIALHEGFTGA